MQHRFATWQHSSQADTSILANLEPSKEETLDVPEILNTLIEPQHPAIATEPVFNQSVPVQYPNQSIFMNGAKKVTFTIRRSATDKKQGRAQFIQEHSTNDA